MSVPKWIGTAPTPEGSYVNTRIFTYEIQCFFNSTECAYHMRPLRGRYRTSFIFYQHSTPPGSGIRFIRLFYQDSTPLGSGGGCFGTVGFFKPLNDYTLNFIRNLELWTLNFEQFKLFSPHVSNRKNLPTLFIKSGCIHWHQRYNTRLYFLCIERSIVQW